MNTVDSLLKTIVNHNPESLDGQISSRDLKALRNLARLVDDPRYITENQAKLVLRLLNDNISKFSVFKNEIDQVTSSPTWAKTFRIIQQLRKIYISRELDLPQIIIEFTFSSDLQKTVLQLAKGVEGLYTVHHGKLYGAALTEKNIVEIIDKLKNFKFTISDELQEYYNTIKSWSKKDVVDQYRITTISHSNFEKHIVNDLGIDTAINENVINDRSMRYQYFVENTNKSPKNLSEMLANRETTKLWVDNNIFSIDDLLQSFIELKRLPVLIVLDTRDEKKCLENLRKISNSLENVGIFDNVGVYFRLDNTPTGKEFNQLIADKKYNCQLTQATKVVVVQSGKIPKFLLKSDWKPMSVVSINHALRHSKTAVYANCCDLVITYTGDKPMIESRFPWE